MKINASIAFLILLFCISCKQDQKNIPAIEQMASGFKTTGSIERFSKKLNELIPDNATIEILAEGFTWTEGPLWIKDGKYLLFSDIPANVINKWSEEEGVSKYLFPSGYTGRKKRGGEPGSNGLILDSNGKLVMCQHGDRKIARMLPALNRPSAVFETIVHEYNGKRFNSPNDAVFDGKGNLYFTDPPYGLEGQMEDPAKELDYQGVFRISSTGKLTLITDKMSRPNGIGLSPDEKTLYVSNSDGEARLWMAFELGDNGEVLNEKVFYDATDDKERGYPDGLKVDMAGNIWATGPGGVTIFSPEAKMLGRIKTGQATSNCAFEEGDKTLYMTCDDYLMRVRLK